MRVWTCQKYRKVSGCEKNIFWLHNLFWQLEIGTGVDPGGTIAPPLKPTKVTLFTMIFYHSVNSIHDISPFCRPLLCHSSVVKYTSSLLQERSRYETWLPNITETAPPKLTGWIRPCIDKPLTNNCFSCVVDHGSYLNIHICNLQSSLKMNFLNIFKIAHAYYTFHLFVSTRFTLILRIALSLWLWYDSIAQLPLFWGN